MIHKSARLAVRYGGKRALIGVVSLTAIQAIFQLLAVASIMPFITLAISPEKSSIQSWFPNSSPSQTILVVGIAVIVFQILAAITGLAGDAARSYFSHFTVHHLTSDLLKRFANRPYSFHLNSNSSLLLKKLRDDAHSWLAVVLLPLMDLVSRLANALLLLCLLFWLDPLVAAAVFLIFSAIYLGVLVGLRGFLARASTRRNELLVNLFQSASEMLNSIKVVFVHGARGEFLERFRHSTRAYASNEAPVAAVGAIPRYLMELLAFGAVVIVVLITSGARGSADSVIPLAATYAVCGYRLLPTFSVAYTQIVGVLSKREVVEQLISEVEADEPETPSPGAELAPFEKQIQLRQVTVRFAEKKIPALHQVSLEIPKSSRVGIVGSSGAGKSTLIDVLLGLVEFEGELIVDGKKLCPEEFEMWRRRIGYVPQEVFLLDRSLAENIAFGVPPDQIDSIKLKRAIELAQLSRFVEELPEGFETVIGEHGARLSGGQRQRIALARALYHEPSILILDEATSALDPATERAVLQAVQKLPDKLTILSAAHRPSVVEKSDLIYVLDGGRVVDRGDFASLSKESPVFQTLFGVPATAA